MEDNVFKTQEINNFNQIYNDNTTINERKICGFWRRIFSLSIDYMVLSIVGFILFSILGSSAYKLGNLTLVIGFFIACSYFGIMNSSVGNGQSVGKKLLKIQVVDINGQFISINFSIIRAIILISPIYISGLLLNPMIQNSSILSGIINFIALAVNLGLSYFYIFNRRTRQSLHDLLLGTYVVNSAQDGRVNVPVVWSGHYKVFALILTVVTAILFIISPRTENKLDMVEINLIQSKLLKLKDVNTVSLTEMHNYVNQDESTSLNVNLLMKGLPRQNENLKKSIVKTIREDYKDIKTIDFVLISISYQSNLGFYNSKKNYNYSIPQSELIN